MSKSIKQLADEIGVSKTAIRKKIDNLGLQYSLQKNKNQLLVPEETENAIKMAFSNTETQTRKLKTNDDTANEIAFYREEIRIKNEQIRESQEEQKRLLQIISDNSKHLENLEEMLKAEMFLKIRSEEKIKALEEKLAEPQPNWFQKFFK